MQKLFSGMSRAINKFHAKKTGNARYPVLRKLISVCDESLVNIPASFLEYGVPTLQALFILSYYVFSILYIFDIILLCREKVLSNLLATKSQVIVLVSLSA